MSSLLYEIKSMVNSGKKIAVIGIDESDDNNNESITKEQLLLVKSAINLGLKFFIVNLNSDLDNDQRSMIIDTNNKLLSLSHRVINKPL